MTPVTCHNCERFEANDRTPSHGLGLCRGRLWLFSKPLTSHNGSNHPQAPWPLAERYCEFHEEKKP